MDSTSPSSPPLSPAPGAQFQQKMGHSRPPSSSANYQLQQRSKRSSSRVTDRQSEDELKTAVKVAVRVRPPLKPSDPGFDLIPHRFRENTCNVPTPSSLSIQSPQGKKLFVFDRVFDEETTQEGVWDYLSDSVSSFIKGYNVSILAYGQSGAGKSYTMGTSGPDEQNDKQVMGIVPRAAQALFSHLNISHQPVTTSGLQQPKRYSQQSIPSLASIAKQGNTSNWELKASYVEIYNEQLNDLLVPENTPINERAQVSIREDTKGRIILTGLTQVPITSVEDLLQALDFGSSIRQTDSTAVNARSSRSHAVFSLNLVQRRAETTPLYEKRKSFADIAAAPENMVTIDSKLHFVDLAGSERLKNTGAKGDRAKEGISINAGLASLGKVISQLSSKNPSAHISYRDSRLTRLLQDSLGGNALTYMVACVTPAVFHLSETLNTVHYAQRARAIQSKPEIQQSHEDSDKQAVIERLRAEISYLRDQLRHTELSDRKGINSTSNRARGHEVLHNQLMDMQENYSALSQRHAKLISDLSRARASDSTEPPLSDAMSEHAMDRVKRSSSFAEAVEQMVVEYEKTIQSLETSLSKTRSSLASAESSLVEKDTRITYMETIQNQLQARVQKAMEREASAEAYLANLEGRIEGASSDEERTAAHVAELRKELARVRESETSAEEYISTLEERLAEAEQDQEMMQREIDRLEHVVERQRSIGRLDNILGEIDMPEDVTPAGPVANGKPKLNGHRSRKSYDPFRPENESQSVTEEEDEDEREEKEVEIGAKQNGEVPAENEIHSPQHTDIMADKVENLTQELFDLRSEHEANLVDYDNLQQKYRTALETLAKMEYHRGADKTKEEPRDSGHSSFLPHAGLEGEEKAGDVQPLSSRLSADMSSRGPSSTTGGDDDKERRGSDNDDATTTDETLVHMDDPPPTPITRGNMQHEMDVLMKLRSDKDVSFAELTNTYKSLASRHEVTLRQVESLKREINLSAFNRPSSPTLMKPKSNRRKSEDLLGIGTERVTRSLNSLKAIAFDHFESTPDVRQNFELSLNSVMNELNNRSERVAALEVELTVVRKEMESKQAIIAGLTRERSSLRATSPVDFSVVGQMRDQLMESENQIRALHEQHSAREKELQEQISTLKASLGGSGDLQRAAADQEEMPGGFPHTPAGTEAGRELGAEQPAAGADQGKEEISRLKSELTAWENKHETAVSSMKSSEAKLLATIAGLEESVRHSSNSVSSADATSRSGAEMELNDSFEAERSQHKQVVDTLQKEVQEYKTAAETHHSKLQELERSYQTIILHVEEETKSRELAHKELQTHKELLANLEDQLKEHQVAVRNHQTALDVLHDTHDKELALLQFSLRQSEDESRKRQAEMEEHHGLIIQNMQADLDSTQSQLNELLGGAAAALGYETDSKNIKTHIKGLVDEGKEVHARHIKTTDELKAVQEELQNALTKTVDLESRVNELKLINDEMILSLEKQTQRDQKNTRIIEELEQQLNSSYDTQKTSHERLSSIHSDTQAQRVALEKELEDQKRRNSSLEHQLQALQRQSIASNASNFQRDSLSPEAAAIALARPGSQHSSSRKSPGSSVLPTPPPSIPLPPLPGTPHVNSSDRTGSPIEQRASSPTHTASPPGSRDMCKESPVISQLVEEQEARIRTIEKHLFAEKQLTATLEEALVDLETSANRTKQDMEVWRKKCGNLEDELVTLRKDKTNQRASLQQVEEEREMRVRAEKARQALEQRMAELNAGKKKKKNALNCF